MRASAPDIRFNNLEVILYLLIKYLLYTFIFANTRRTKDSAPTSTPTNHASTAEVHIHQPQPPIPKVPTNQQQPPMPDNSADLNLPIALHNSKR